jgi:hypothetical protein
VSALRVAPLALALAGALAYGCSGSPPPTPLPGGPPPEYEPPRAYEPGGDAGSIDELPGAAPAAPAVPPVAPAEPALDAG